MFLSTKLSELTVMYVGIYLKYLFYCQQYDAGHVWVGVICVLAVVLYIIFFASGPGAIPWFFTAELFAQGPRPAAVSIGVLFNWSANFCVGLFYPFLQESINAYSFIPFVVFLAIFWIFTLFKVPETKGRTIEEITAQFQITVPYNRIPLTEDTD
ncbi:solute carrier family 2, facilitated glucose transporter member 3-like isoform X1 [Ruditapes philippinarum]|uniref:solute carrier family 2, facilitated glucose transporter member 3-like isoform X1 n=1 Tax=Ruditapes philippinarum TaxID=129788 RepID=UPI00295A71E8|nr:solute carrier family 2, facilitated glucose transporter member 3-like isoform X1 [Ruditapes philippinarum]